MTVPRSPLLKLLSLLGASVMLVLLTLLMLAHFSPARLEPLVERLVSDALGRSFRIGELVEVQLGAEFSILARDLELGNPAGMTPTEMASAGLLAIRLDLPSLWQSGPIRIVDLEVHELTLDLKSIDEETANWVFSTTESDPAQEPDDSAVNLPVLFLHADLRDLSIRYRDADQDIRANIQTLSLAARDDNTMTDLDLVGVVNDMPLMASGFIGPPPALLSGRGLELKLDLALADLEARASGRVEDATSMQGLDLSLDVAATKARPYLDLLGLQEVRDGKMHFEGHIRDTGKVLELSGKGSLAEFDWGLTGVIRNPATMDDLNVDLFLNGPSMAEIGAAAGINGFRDVPYSLSAYLQRKGPLLHIEHAELKAGEGLMTLSARLPAFPDIDNWQASINGRGLDLAVLAAVTGLADIPARAFDFNGELSSNAAGEERITLTAASDGIELDLDGIVGEYPDLIGTRLIANLQVQDVARLASTFDISTMTPGPAIVSAQLENSTGEWRLENGRAATQNLELELSGAADQLPNPQSVNGLLRVTAPDLYATLSSLGVQVPTTEVQSLDLEGRVNLTDGGLELSDIEGQLADMAFTGRGLLSTRAGLSGSRLMLNASGSDAGALLRAFTDVPVPAERFALSLDASYQPPLLNIDDLELDLGDHRLQAELIADTSPDATDKIGGKATVSGPGLRDLANLFDTDAPFPPERDYTLAMNLQVGSDRVSVNELKLNTGKSDLQGQLSWFFDSERPRLDARLHSDRLDLTYLFPDRRQAAAQSRPEADSESDGAANLLIPPTAEELEERLIPDTPLPVEWMSRFDGDIVYRAERMQLRDDVQMKLNAKLELKNAVLVTRQLDWRGNASWGKIDLTLDTRGNANQFRLKLASNRVPLMWLMARDNLATKDAIYRLQLTGSGRTARAMAASLDGAMLFRGSGAHVDNRGLDVILGSTVGAVFDRLDPTAKTEPYTALECDAGAITFNSGVVELDPGLAGRVESADISATGIIDLNNEHMGISFNSRPRKGIGISAGKAITPYFRLEGTLARPFLTLDPEAVATSGTAAVATLGLSIVARGLWDRWVNTSEDPCAALFEIAREDPEQRYKGLQD